MPGIIASPRGPAWVAGAGPHPLAAAPFARMYALVRTAAGLALDVFYRRRTLGRPLPPRGPLVLVANHPNGLVDAAVLMQLERPVRFLGKAPLFDMPLLGRLIAAVGTLPVYRSVDGADTARNEGTFDAVYDALEAGEAICLFPEGVSHSLPALQRLKTGAARMALGAERRAAPQRGPLGVTIVPVGLSYGHKARFRSRQATWVGDPIGVADLLAEHVRDERAAVQRLTERIAEGLRRVTVQLDDWEDLPLVELAERLWPRDGADPLERTQRFASGLRALRRSDPARADLLQRRVAEFRDRLEWLGLTPGEIELRYTPGGVARFALKNAALLCATAPAALVGLALWWLPHRAVGWISSLRRVEPDIVATQKLIVGLALHPLWYAGLLLAAHRLGGTPALLAAALVAPAGGILAVRFGDRLRSVRSDVAGFLRFRGAASLKARLAARRRELLREFEDVRDSLVEREAEVGGR